MMLQRHSGVLPEGREDGARAAAAGPEALHAKRGAASGPQGDAASRVAVDDDAVVVARLPLLGPVIGWTRPIGKGVMRSRIWACLDGYESETPLAMLTLAWDRARGEMRPGSVRLWKLNAVRLEQDGLERCLHIGLADALLPIDGPDYTVRVVALHRCIRHPLADPARRVQLDLPPEERCGEGWRPAISSGRELLALLRSEESWATRSVAQAGRPVAVGDLWPQPKAIDVAALLPQPRSRRAIGAWLDEFAHQALQGLADADAAAEDLRRLHLESPTPPLRKPLRSRTIDSSAAAPGPAVRASMRATVEATSPAGRTTLRFAAGCCRYPGTAFERERADSAIELLAARGQSPDGVAFAIFSGDQIYADATAGVFDTLGRREKVAARYESAYGTPAFSELARRLPLYLTADDHEISDGWSLPASQAAHLSQSEIFRNERLRDWASQLFLAYQRMHGPPPAAAASNWYAFSVAGVHFFMMDTRFERGLPKDGAAPPLCSEAQLAAVGSWLREVAARQPDAPKFIVSGSVFAPGLVQWDGSPAERVRGDSWQGFVHERAAVARLVAEAAADHVVFLSGDYHCAAVAAIDWVAAGAERTSGLQAWSIVSPPLYAPFPFANSRVEEVLLDESICEPSGALLARCRARAFGRSGFTIVTVTHGGNLPPVLEVEFVDPFALDRDRSLVVRLSEMRTGH